MNRRTFLKTTGIGAVAIAIPPSIIVANNINFECHKSFKNSIVCVYFKDDHFLEVAVPDNMEIGMFFGPLMELADADFVYRHMNFPRRSTYYIAIIKDRDSHFANSASGIEGFEKYMSATIKKQYPNKSFKNIEIGTMTDLTGYSDVRDKSGKVYKIRRTTMG